MKMNLLILTCFLFTFACASEEKPVNNNDQIVDSAEINQRVTSDPLKEDKKIETPVGKKTKKVEVLSEPKPIKVPVKKVADQESDKKIKKPTSNSTQKPAPPVEKKAKVEIKNTPQPEKKILPKPITKKPILFFSDTIHDYGFIDEGDTIKHSFKFLNRGDAPLEILDVQVSCGCMSPTYSFLDVEPGRLSKIEVTFLSKGKLGPQIATIDVLTNAKNPSQTLYLKGVIR